MARLTLIGRRAVAPLCAALGHLPPEGRADALEVLARIGDAAAIPAVVDRLADPEGAVAMRAAAAAATLGGKDSIRSLAQRMRAPGLPGALAAVAALGRLGTEGSVECLDHLLGAAVDETLDEERRLSALDAAAAVVSGSDLDRVLERLASSAAPRVAADAVARLAARTPRQKTRKAAPTPAADESARTRALVAQAAAVAGQAAARRRWLASVEAEGPKAAEAVNEALAQATEAEHVVLLAEAAGRLGVPASIPVLRDTLPRWRLAPDSGRVAAAVHTALASLGSRVALDDLRMRIAAASGPTGASLARAIGLVGDASFLSPLAALAERDRDLAPVCEAAAGSLASRHRVNNRNRAVKDLPRSQRPIVQAWLSRKS